MSPEEKEFMKCMDDVNSWVEGWRDGTLKITLTDDISFMLKQYLKQAGTAIGLRPRFEVVITHRPRDIQLSAKNGAAGRMLVRYRHLHIKRELADGY